MTAILRAEVLKLRTVRSTWLLGLFALALSILMVVTATATFGTEPHAITGIAQRADLLTIGIGLLIPFVIVLGVLIVGTEYRQGTITPTLLSTPRRRSLIAAKTVVATIWGMVLAVLAVGIAVVLVSPMLSSKGYPLHLTDPKVVHVIAGAIAYGALAACFGVGLGAIFRQPVGGIVAALMIPLAFETAFAAFLPESVSKFMPFNAASQMVAAHPSAGALSGVAGGLVFAGWAAAVLVAGTIVVSRTDVA